MARGFLLGATAGRTTLNGEGLQHEDGHSHLIAATNPAVVAYDPAFAFEIAHIVENGLHRMYGEDAGERLLLPDRLQRADPPAGRAGRASTSRASLKGLYRYSPAPAGRPGDAPKANILASGTGMQWALKAQQLLAEDWGVAADVWSVTSWTELRRDAVECEEHNLLNPGGEPRVPYVQQQAGRRRRARVAVSDWMRAVPDLIARWVPGDYTSLGTDGFGMSDTRHALRRHFHVDAESIAVATLRQLALRGEVPAHVPAEAAKKYAIDDVTAAPVGETGGDS